MQYSGVFFVLTAPTSAAATSACGSAVYRVPLTLRAAREKTGASFDLVVDEGIVESWNFLTAEDRGWCWRRLKQKDPWIVIGSPPRTVFSRLQGLNNERGDPAKRQRKEVEGKVLLNFALDVYQWQIRRGC